MGNVGVWCDRILHPPATTPLNSLSEAEATFPLLFAFDPPRIAKLSHLSAAWIHLLGAIAKFEKMNQDTKL
ncbi:hypothetical protein [Nostoc parmelioides]|uniref:Uncharacterized protein n=1 Tax=Nostoc parmelioides FACHB-3921 TaxID=2692909 RepID=A0ABR8BRM7_9NOSO|nr:hypothetical protein [Nostoc parmelioides]MBD2255593.1 hypothetical protein [Nostoc parmelioides FACHB-3921]